MLKNRSGPRFSVPSAWRNTLRAWPRPFASPRSQPADDLCSRGFATTGEHSSTRTTTSPRRSRRSARLLSPKSGSSTTSTSSTGNCWRSRDHLPPGYYRRLPKIADGHLVGYPRVYALAWAYVAHTDSRFEVKTLGSFIRAYQRTQPLSIGELWAAPIHLRMALVENLRRLSERVVRARHARAEADDLADRLLGLSGRPAENAEDVLRHLDDTSLSDAFAVQLVQRLRDQDESVTPALAWLNRKLSVQVMSPGEVVAREHQAQGAANATVRNVITSMRQMSSIDWLEFFESVSLVDEELRDAPAFLAMDFDTRDEYRKQVEVLSRVWVSNSQFSR